MNFLNRFQNIKKRLRSRIGIAHCRTSSIRPVFVIGLNRSGTSLASFLVAQHPDLEGLFVGADSPGGSDKSGHAAGFCESYHIWDWLFREAGFGTRSDDCLWSHPSNISRFYRDEKFSKTEGERMLRSLEAQRKTKLRPVVKDQFNALRIRLLKTLYPDCSFVLVVREIEDYISSCYHKWCKSEDKDLVGIALHWNCYHQTVLHDLNIYYPDNFVILDYSKFYSGAFDLQKEFDTVFLKLGLSPFKLNLDLVDRSARYREGNEVQKVDLNFPTLHRGMEVEATKRMHLD